MVTRLMIVNDPNEEDRDESAVERGDRAEYIRGPERRRLILELARGSRRIVDIAAEFDRPPQTISNFKYRNKREIQELGRVLMEKTADLFFSVQHYRISEAEKHLAYLDDQIRRMLEAADREENPEPLDLKEFRGLISEANKIRKEIREELKPTMTVGEIQITPPKGYGGTGNWFEGEEK